MAVKFALWCTAPKFHKSVAELKTLKATWEVSQREPQNGTIAVASKVIHLTNGAVSPTTTVK